MKMRKLLVFFFVFFSILNAENLKLIGVNKKGSFPLSSYDLTGIKSIQAYLDGSLKAFDPALPKEMWNDIQPFLSFEGGKGYWIVFETDNNSNINFEFSGEEISLNDIKIKDSELALVAFPSNMEMSNIITFFENNNCKVKSIQAYLNGSLKAFDPALPKEMWNDIQPFTKSEEGMGYWVVFDGKCTISESNNSISPVPSPSGIDNENILPPSIPTDLN